MEYKQAIIVRQDLKMPKGKLAAQVAHASVEATMASDKDIVEKWRESGSKKVILKIKELEELRKLFMLGKSKRIPTALIKDAGNTFFSSPTITCLGLGPSTEEEIDSITKSLSLL